MTYTDRAWRESMRIRLDINNALEQAIGPHGLPAAAIEQHAPRAAAAVAALDARRAELGWPELPAQDVSAVEQLAAAIRGRAESFVVLGIGGSALGNIAVQTALNHTFYNELPLQRRGGPKLYVIDNSDPELNAHLLETVDLARTVFNVISKSGTTAETMASFLLVRDALARAVGERRLREHLVLTTDPSGGFLRQIGEREGWPMLDLPPKVGGRFSVLTTVGLLSAAVTGVDIRALLAGAAYGYELARERDPLRNPAALAALVAWLLAERGKNILVMMPYAQRLARVSDWFAQLWAESLGKKQGRDGRTANVGSTPVKALGATDQHSQVQLYVEGPYDKLVNFLAVERYGVEVPIPLAYADLEGVAYLGGHTFNELISAEQRATAIALSEAGRPNITHTLPEVNAFTLGQLFMLLEMQTAIAGELWDINAFDQPGVEAGKVATYALLGRAGYEARRREIISAQAKREARWVV
ncbi:MAG TPA: glucose-6-phosphate isomerase [Roseiflexaceae bacterium]|nr:glucose-6-phosphate isomerase [Roseiflexaceae bacterium]